MDDNSIRNTNVRLSLALSNGISKADAEEGQVIVMEIFDDSTHSPIVGHASLRINHGEGGSLLKVATVKESNCITLTLGDQTILKDPEKSIKILQELLKRCGAEAMSKADGDGETSVSGYSYVSMPDNNHYRHIAFCGYFPADKPKYGIIVWMKRQEESEESKDKDRPELGVNAASVCKRIADYLMKNETNQ